MGSMLILILEIVAVALITAGVTLISVPAGLIILGVASLAFAIAIERKTN